MEVGLGNWTGSFHFRVTDWQGFWSDRIGLKNRLLVLSMFLLLKLTGQASIVSRLVARPREGDLEVVANEVRITRLGLTLYLLREEYLLQADCRQVWVRSKERFGPLPFLFNVSKEHPAEILDEGMRAVYYIPLLGAQWVGRYSVRLDRNHIDSTLTCAWAEAEEVISRVV